MFDEDDSGSTTLVSFLLGGLAGASLAVLFMPHTGQETRRRLGHNVRGRTERLARRGRSLLDDASARLTRRNGGDGHAEDSAAMTGRVPEPGLPTTTPGYEGQA
jgi:hypothetical protein